MYSVVGDRELVIMGLGRNTDGFIPLEMPGGSRRLVLLLSLQAASEDEDVVGVTVVAAVVGSERGCKNVVPEGDLTAGV